MEETGKQDKEVYMFRDVTDKREDLSVCPP